MLRMTTPSRITLLLFVRTHAQLRFYFNLRNTDVAANQNGLGRAFTPPAFGNVVEIHPIRRRAVSERGF
jgi:hypothetical protein